MVAKIEFELKIYNYKKNKSDDPVISPLGYNPAYEHNGTHIQIKLDEGSLGDKSCQKEVLLLYRVSEKSLFIKNI